MSSCLPMSKLLSEHEKTGAIYILLVELEVAHFRGSRGCLGGRRPPKGPVLPQLRKS